MFDKDKKKELTKFIREWNNLREKMDKMDLMTPEERADLLDQFMSISKELEEKYHIAFSKTEKATANAKSYYELFEGVEMKKFKDLQKSFKPFTRPLAIPRTKYKIQLGLVKGYWVSLLLDGNTLIDSYIYREEKLNSYGFPSQYFIGGWVLRTVPNPKFSPHQLRKILQNISKQIIKNKEWETTKELELQHLRDWKMYLLKEKLGKIRKENNQNDSEGDHFPYPYIFKPPKPPDDLAMTPQVQVHAPPKDENPDDERVCQFCGLKLTEEEQHTHSCKKKPE